MKSENTILFLLNRECSFLPPFMSIIDVLCGKYNLKIISYETLDSLNRLKKLYSNKNVEFLFPVIQKPYPNSTYHRIVNRFKRIIGVKSAFHKSAARLLNQIDYDMLWIVHEDTIYEFKNDLKSKKYIASLYELNDHRPKFLKAIKLALQKANEVIVPEYNRACILRTWESLSKTPTILPNKPFAHPLKRNIKNRYTDILEGKKIILYQGYIQRSRNLDALCEACKSLPQYNVVIMGDGDQTYIDELKRKYPQIIHISFVTPPEHLYITSYAHIAIVKYDYIVLNAIFCAPNKTWEYTGFGIPVLCHDIPGLNYTIGNYKAGICCDMDNEDSIKAALKEIDANYKYYSENALKYYNSFDVYTAIHNIVNRNIVKKT